MTKLTMTHPSDHLCEHPRTEKEKEQLKKQVEYQEVTLWPPNTTKLACGIDVLAGCE